MFLDKIITFLLDHMMLQRKIRKIYLAMVNINFETRDDMVKKLQQLNC